MKRIAQLMLVGLVALALTACAAATGGTVQFTPESAHQEQIGAVAGGP